MKYSSIYRGLAILVFVMAFAQKAFSQYIMAFPSVYYDYINPTAFALDSKGGIFVAGSTTPSGFVTSCYVYKWNGTNDLNPWELFAGDGWVVFGGDGGPATAATLGEITSMAADNKGNVYLLDYGNLRVRKVDTNGIITTFAGGGSSIYAIDGVEATTALLNNPTAIACDKWGNVYIAQTGDSRIRKVDTNGIIRTIAGTGIYGYTGDGGPATAADLQITGNMTVDTAGNIYMNVGANIRKISTDGMIRSVAGNGLPGYAGDGGPATSASVSSGTISVDRSGNLYLMQITDSILADYASLRKTDAIGTITTVARMNHYWFWGWGYYSLVSPEYPIDQTVVSPGGSLQSDGAGNLYYLDTVWNLLLKISTHGAELVSYYGNSHDLSACSYDVINLSGYLSVYDSAGTFVHWTVATPPAHGVLVCSDYLAVTSGLLTPSGITYTPDSGFSGIDTLIIAVSDGVETLFDTVRISVIMHETILGVSVLCADGSEHALYLSTPVIWDASYDTWYGGVGGTDTVMVRSYSPGVEVLEFWGACTWTTKTITFSAPVISGSSLVCIGDTIMLSASMPGGVWSAAGTHLTVSDSGIVTGITTGLDTIVFSEAGCSARKQVQVGLIDLLPADTLVCSGSYGFLLGGVDQTWTNSNPYAIYIDPHDFYGYAYDTGVSVITTTNSCGTASNSIIVNAMPGAIGIVGMYELFDPYNFSYCNALCSGATYLAYETTTGGTWSASGGHVEIDSVGNIHTLDYSGTAIDKIIYTKGGCSATLSVNVVSSNVSILSDSIGCPGSDFGLVVVDSNRLRNLYDYYSYYWLYSGYWYYMWNLSCSNPVVTTTDISVASVAATDPFENYYSCSNVTAGIVTFTYNSGCATVSRTVTINPQPDAPDVPYDICAGSTITATDATPGGTWSTSYGNVSITSAGVVSAVHDVWDMIYYALPTGCYNTAPIFVSTVSPAPILGNHTFCAGEYLNLTDSVAHGVWISSNTAVVSNEMVAVGAGTAIITYNNGCGQVTRAVTVFPSPDPIFGDDYLCSTSTASFSEGSTGGTWSVTGPGSISTAGVYTPSGAGDVFINYTFPTGCVYSHALEVDAPATTSAISGDSVFCGFGEHSGILESVSGGHWTSSNYSIAYPEYFSTSSGLYFSSSASGADTLTYTVSNACGTFSAERQITVYPASGNTFSYFNLCVGSVLIISDTNAAGIWHNYNSHASIMSLTTLRDSELVTGVSAGVDTITLVHSDVCGFSVRYYIVSIIPDTAISPIGGPSSICWGGTATYTDATAGGYWSVTGTSYTGYMLDSIFYAYYAPGLAEIIYTVNYTGYCPATATKSVIVFPETGPISESMRIVGPSTICFGSEATYTDTIAGGYWNLESGYGTMYDSIYYPWTPGIDTISYTALTSGHCYVTTKKGVTVEPPAELITDSMHICEGTSTVFSAHYLGGIWSSIDTNAIVLYSYVSSSVFYARVEALTEPRDTINYTITSSCGTYENRHILLIDVYLPATPISGDSVLCIGDSISLSADPLSGVWSSSRPAVASVNAGGVVYGLAFGTSVITYAASNTCDTIVLTKPVTVYPTSTLNGLDSIRLCVGRSIAYAIPAGGGSWSSSGSAVALSSGSDTEFVSGLYPGTDTVYYTVSGMCGTTVYKHVVNVSGPVSAGTITGTPELCMGSTETLADLATDGHWSSGSPSVASISGSGVVTAVSPGVAQITYSVYSCDTNIATFQLTVYPIPTSSSVLDSFDLCPGASISLVDPFSGGSWTTAFGRATASASGDSVHLSAASSGTDTLYYSLEGFCGTITDKYFFRFSSSSPDAGIISGSLALCSGSFGLLTSSVGGGIWSGSGSSMSFVSGGTIVGSSPGTTTVTYSVSNACGHASATAVVTVFPLPSLSIDSTNLCEGSTLSLTVPFAGGSWTMANGHAEFATAGSGGRNVLGVSPGRDTAVYNFATFCGTDEYIHILKMPTGSTIPPICGDSVMCYGETISLSDTLPGGYWSSSYAGIAEVFSGIVYGISPGIVTIYYSYTGCETLTAEKTITVTAPVGYIIADTSSICMGASITVNPTSTVGVWSVTNNHLTSDTVGSRLTVTGVTSGRDTAIYSFASGCIYGYYHIVNVLPESFMSPIIGVSALCLGYSDTMTDTTAGGTWTSSSVSLATIDSSGLITAVASGVDTVCYTGIGVCGVAASACKAVTVGVLTPVYISGTDSLCRGTSTTYSASASGGTWISEDTGVVSVSGGVVHALSAGTTSIVYSKMEACGAAATDTLSIFVDTLPVLNISGPDTLCLGSTATFMASTSGGVWSLTNTSGAGTITPEGMYAVSALATGEDSVIYSQANVCGAAMSGLRMIIEGLPESGVIIGADSMCPGAMAAFTETVSGGNWSLAGSHATITPTGTVAYVSPGYDTVKYEVHNYCGSTTTSHVLNCLPTTSIAPVIGPATVCDGGSITLADSSAGGEWRAANPTATVISSGESASLDGIAVGVDTVYYVTRHYCGDDSAIAVITVAPFPAATPISGRDTLCAGSSITLSDSTTGGRWSITGGGTVYDGVVYSEWPGTDTVIYSYINSCHSVVEVRKEVRVFTVPSGNIITGPSSVCRGNLATFNDTVAGGAWLVTNSADTISSGGVFIAGLSGSTTIMHISTNFCGADTSMKLIIVDSAAPVTFAGSTFVCIGGQDTLEITPAGGIVTALNGKAHISSENVVTGIEAGIDTLVYTYSNSCGTMSGRFTIHVFTDWGCDSINLVPGVQGNANGGIDIFPNPGTGRYEVKLPVVAKEISVVIKDMPGQTVFEARYENTDKIIADISGRSAGSYLIQVFADGAVYYGKLVLW